MQYFTYGKCRGLSATNVTQMVKENKDHMASWTKGRFPS
jgi:hypothetical protein